MGRQREKVGTLSGRGGKVEAWVAGRACTSSEAGKLGLELKYWEEEQRR